MGGVSCLVGLRAEGRTGLGREQVRGQAALLSSQGGLPMGAQQPKPPLGPMTGVPEPRGRSHAPLLTCPTLQSLKSLHLHRHHHAVKAAKVRGGHHTPGERQGCGVSWAWFWKCGHGGTSALGHWGFYHHPNPPLPDVPQQQQLLWPVQDGQQGAHQVLHTTLMDILWIETPQVSQQQQLQSWM